MCISRREYDGHFWKRDDIGCKLKRELQIGVDVVLVVEFKNQTN